jgi:hypothetical protein
MALRLVRRRTLIRARVLATRAFLFHLECALFAVLTPEDGDLLLARYASNLV